jgi:hypothetical protein
MLFLFQICSLNSRAKFQSRLRQSFSSSLLDGSHKTIEVPVLFNRLTSRLYRETSVEDHAILGSVFKGEIVTIGGNPQRKFACIESTNRSPPTPTTIYPQSITFKQFFIPFYSTNF